MAAARPAFLNGAVTPASAASVGEDPAAHLRILGEGQPVLMLHGWGASSALFDPVLPGLQPQRQLILPDLPGFGATLPPPAAWSAHDYAQWVLALLDRTGTARCDVIGHSMGGRVAIVLGALHRDRVRRIVLVDSAGIRPRPTMRARLRVRTFKLMRRAQGMPLLPESVRRRVTARTAQSGSADYRAASGTVRATLVRLVNEDLTPLLPRITAPTLLVWGEQDAETPLGDARTMERLIPDAGLVVFPGAGHFSYLEQPVRFVRVIDTFLRSAG